MLIEPGRSVALVVAAATMAVTVGAGSEAGAGSSVNAETSISDGSSISASSEVVTGPVPGAASSSTTAAGAASTSSVAAAPTSDGEPPSVVPARTPAAPSPGNDSPTSTEPAGVVSDDLTDGLPGDRPNIVVIMTDDMREDELAFMPNVQRLIGDQGVRFVNSFSPFPLCCPARASFLTGQYAHNHGVWSNTMKYGFGAFDDTSTVATDLSAAGYQTAFLGKYLNGYGPVPPRDGSARHSFRYVPPGWQDWRGTADKLYGAGTPEAGGTYNYFDTTLSVNGVLEGHGREYQTRVFGAETQDMLEGLSRSPKPFFLWVSYVAPHAGGPREPDDPKSVLRDNGREAKIISPARPRDVHGMFDAEIPRSLGAVREEDLSDKPLFLRYAPSLNDAEVAALTRVSRQRAESLYVVDQQVARTVDVLERTGELDDTVLVFTSDNGYLLGEHGRLQTKRLPYESSLRVPTLMAGPGIPHGVEREDPFLTEDFAPTFLDLAGARTDRSMDGTSLLDVALHGDQGWTRPVLTEAGRRSMRHGGRPPLDVRPAGPSALRFSQGLRTSRYLYVEHATGERELYDLRADPLELTSVVDRPRMAQVVAQLARVLERMRMCRGESCRAPLPPSLQAD